MGSLKGRTALITGAGAGIGRAAALRFAREGANVAVAEIAEDAGTETVRLIEANGGQALFIATDVTRSDSVAHAVARTVSVYGRLDILYNNAGGTLPADAPVTEASDDAFWATLQRDLYGTWLGCKHGIPELIRSGGGAVLNASSMVALMGRPGRDAYTVAKGGIAALTRGLAAQYAPDRVRVNALAPGIVLTERLKARLAGGHIPEGLISRHLLGLVEPEDVAAAALFLVSDEARMITGHVLPVDSGAVMS